MSMAGCPARRRPARGRGAARDSPTPPRKARPEGRSARPGSRRRRSQIPAPPHRPHDPDFRAAAVGRQEQRGGDTDETMVMSAKDFRKYPVCACASSASINCSAPSVQGTASRARQSPDTQGRGIGGVEVGEPDLDPGDALRQGKERAGGGQSDKDAAGVDQAVAGVVDAAQCQHRRHPRPRICSRTVWPSRRDRSSASRRPSRIVPEPSRSDPSTM